MSNTLKPEELAAMVAADKAAQEQTKRGNTDHYPRIVAAAVPVLEAAKEPLHYREITRRMVAAGYVIDANYGTDYPLFVYDALRREWTDNELPLARFYGNGMFGLTTLYFADKAKQNAAAIRNTPPRKRGKKGTGKTVAGSLK